MRLPLPKFILLLMLFMIGVSVVDADTERRDWAVVEVSGGVYIKDANNITLSTQTGTRLDAPFTVKTAGDGRAIVSHGQDKLTVGPDSIVAVPRPTPTESGVVTRISQTLGSVLYHVEHRIMDSFEVDTPYLVSVVKGTTFNIRVTPDDSTVALIEGRLFVHTPDMKSELTLNPGQAAIKSKLSDGIILKDQQSLSSPRQGPITVANDGGLPASKSTADTPDINATSSRNMASQSSAPTDIGNIYNVEGISTDEDISSLAGSVIDSVGINVGGGNLVNLGTNISSVSTSASISSGSLIDLGASVGNVTTSVGSGSGSVVDLGASIGDVSTSASIGDGNVIDIGASVGSVTTSVSGGGGSVVDLGAGIGNVTTSASVGGGSVIDLGANVDGVSASVGVGGGGGLVNIVTGVTDTSITSGLDSTTTTATTATATSTAASAASTATTQLPILGPVLNTITLPGL